MLLATFAAPAQDSLFVQRSGAGLLLAGKPFYAIGANAHYFPELAVCGDTNHVMEVLSTARQFGSSTSGLFIDYPFKNPYFLFHRFPTSTAEGRNLVLSSWATHW